MVSKLLERVFEFLDRFYIKNDKKLDPLGVTAMNIFKENCYAKMKIPLIEEIKKQFHDDRNGNVVDVVLLKKVIQCYVDMGMGVPKPNKNVEGFYWMGTKNLMFYNHELEAHILSETKREYEAKAKKWIAEQSALEYL